MNYRHYPCYEDSDMPLCFTNIRRDRIHQEGLQEDEVTILAV